MTRITPDQEWWTATALAGAALPDLPETRQGVDDLAKRLDWRAHPQFARRRSGRGGGWEYHWKLLPSRAQTALLRAANTAPVQPEQAPRMDRGDAWAWFDGLPEHVKSEAQMRLRIIQLVEALQGALGKYMAVETIARNEKKAARTIWNWFEMIGCVDEADRLPYLAPRHRAAKPRAKKVDISPEFFDYLKGAYLRPEGGSFAAAFAVVAKIAGEKGWPVPHQRTALRRLNETVPRVVQIYAREGLRGLERCFPPQRRDRTGMAALEGVNADFHKLDIFVQWPDIEKPIRPQIVVFQDLYSGKFLSWRYDVTPNKVATMSAFGDMVETWGIPKHVTFDNGREFANKWLTGGVENRFRFKVLDDEPVGVLPLLGIELHFATPHHGQAKPIERAFRDLTDRVARDPRFAGAYVGARPDAKPSNYGTHVIPFEEFVRICDQGIHDHNARQGRLSDTAKGRSFDDTFAESYERTPIRKATPEQRRLWLMGQEVRKLDRNNGRFKFLEFEYWSDWMAEFAGEKVVGRFDPYDLNAGLHVYSLDGKFLGFAECTMKAAFYDHASAKAHAKQKSDWKREQRTALKKARPVGVKDVAAALDACPQPEAAPVATKIVHLAGRSHGPLIQRDMPVPELDPALEDRRAGVLLSFPQAPEEPTAPVETAEDRFRRAIDILGRAEAGLTVGSAEAEWVRIYQNTPEFTRQQMMFEDFGDDGLTG